jgi:hypothetical protein
MLYAVTRGLNGLRVEAISSSDRELMFQLSVHCSALRRLRNVLTAPKARQID